jgi:hypothetical protein
MVEVVAVTLLETCLDSSVVKEIEIDHPLDEPLMRHIAADARLLYYPHFPRPYFRIERARAYVIQGVFGNRKLRVTFSPSAGPEVEPELIRLIAEAGV